MTRGARGAGEHGTIEVSTPTSGIFAQMVSHGPDWGGGQKELDWRRGGVGDGCTGQMARRCDLFACLRGGQPHQKRRHTAHAGPIVSPCDSSSHSPQCARL